MFGWVRRGFRRAYERVLSREIGDGPTHVAIIQDGNRRYARKHGGDAPDGHRAGAQTAENVLTWCEELGIEELTLYTFSTENFDRPPHEREPLFDLIEDKLYEFAESDRVHDSEVVIRAIGEVDMLPDRLREAVDYAESRTADYDGFTLNVALAYGGRAELLGAARDVCHAVESGELSPEDVDVSAVDQRLSRKPVRDVDLIIRTGGDERTSNFLPWHANGNEAAVYFCAPYWPEFSRVDLLRGIRTYESREKSWQRTRTERAVTLVRAVAEVELADARAVAGRLRKQLPSSGADKVSAELAKRSDEMAD
ncbi:di-trans,poly-cis-decaprenylcistransferase [Haloferax mediterranei ATCC 33500]|uniref:Tritrans,polycis-undecaprenyl-diphosphate synthase (geranylgeranyl-diphosphate specific) n=1 Tax=Haloferax mediterranei (strain ATCC 33500 / DSM 1411 / JCM 8866 / NBRC 14739 / NCIMB 2177 / R-4) TaxID=523841 RepID=I3R702_HALMT|nr:polyprenyl diphosphate synthase [Haloferax mediterranei]AFK20012.1 Undecaprenyl pyrophosphate synthetase [Haloferax mediterranei ATCC 33500]AHZ23390.1 UDP pyrophosphate synthase [Haloferax mediterranei ATCC 33500]ELZ99559.1 UDP diphosphate synthase [Haloferax mediterranei ATCC 33500]MDX5987236.1 polyprenyl diphosphate synthase [Haloferax mediterranei ATCC 33500]QCQ73758.1 di-trans,poly-cis-decaprenylcistransferase [Haloferax mediterranei ATCC 33500]